VSTFAKVEEAGGLYTNRKVPYFVTTLKIGWRLFTRDTSGSLNYLCPILVERKSIESVVRSIHDGRWKQCQKERLYQGQYMFGYEDSRMIQQYIIKGNLVKRQEVTGEYVGSSFRLWTA
jgi:ERCC4-type nuclease